MNTSMHDLNRVDGVEKVTGSARYSAEFSYPNLHYASIVTATIASGEIVSLNASDSLADPDVIGVLDFRNAPRMERVDIFPLGPAGESEMPLQNARIRYAGQSIALVVAKTPEAARHGADRVHVEYRPVPPRVMDSLLATGEEWADPPDALRKQNDATRADASAELNAADVVVRSSFTTPGHSPNALELGASVAVWDGHALLLHDSTQWVLGTRNAVARALKLSLDAVRVVSPYVGGGFGSKCFVWSHTLLAAAASIRFKVPVQIVLTRAQAHQSFGIRPQAYQRIEIGATRDGKLTAIRHESVAQTSMTDSFLRSASEVSEVLYAAKALSTRNRMMRVHSCTPSNMRAPAESYGSFALEGAMDELAFRLSLDPLELRRRNLPLTHPDGLPWSSCALATCYEEGATRFGWSRRPLQPGTMRENGELVGWGMAAGAYGSYRSQAAVKLKLLSDGSVEASSASHEIGTGTLTLIASLAAQTLSLPISRVSVRLGDTSLPTAPVHGASRTAASIGPASQAAARELLARLVVLAVEQPSSPLAGCPAELIEPYEGSLRMRTEPSRSDPFSAILQRANLAELDVQTRVGPAELNDRDWQTLATGINTIRQPRTRTMAMYAFCAHFVEVRVRPELGAIRISRVVTRAAGGRILNPKQAHSQLLGSVVMGVGMALFEQVRFDPSTGRMVSASPTDYEIPAFAHVPDTDLCFVEEHDEYVNELGAKGIGELGLVGFAAAVANALWHATGERFRSLPISPARLIELSETLL